MTQRRRRKRRVSYPAALAAATLLVAKHELQQRTGMGLWGPLATRLLAQRLGARTATEIVMRAGHWGPVAARALAHRMGYGSPLQMASQLSSQIIRRAQGKLNPPQE